MLRRSAADGNGAWPQSDPPPGCQNRTGMKPDLHWALSPVTLLLSLLALGIYVRRWRAVRTSGSPRAAAQAPVWRLCCFVAATLVVLAALDSPIDSLADQLFSAHMVQHMLLLDLAPILGILAMT